MQAAHTGRRQLLRVHCDRSATRLDGESAETGGANDALGIEAQLTRPSTA